MGSFNWWYTFSAAFVGTGASAWLLVQGFSKVLGDRMMARFNHDLDKRLKEHEALLTGPTHMTQLQLNAEMAALTECFGKLGRLRLSFNSLRPPFTVEKAGISNDERRDSLETRVVRFVEELNAVTETVESHFAFLPEDIYQSLGKCMQAANAELISIQTTAHLYFSDLREPDIRKEWWQSAKENADEFNSGYSKAANLARERMRSLSLIKPV